MRTRKINLVKEFFVKKPKNRIRDRKLIIDKLWGKCASLQENIPRKLYFLSLFPHIYSLPEQKP